MAVNRWAADGYSHERRPDHPLAAFRKPSACMFRSRVALLPPELTPPRAWLNEARRGTYIKP
ncbi:hypothetical protein PGT21_017756 [Puccinia graminis f. sp. tritici]|uniref:Uncharacterized protein n=1 Tax=Puccinia graminis f. sp. tritici TaxID=56615 RepID=A0A5B0PK94_PUCGR|nr:hypothetical protein PGT21_017756 [Puccinia graminis f. sp. tritici]